MPENLAFVDDVSPVRNRKRLSHIVVRNQHSNTGSFHIADYLLQIEYRNGINPGKRLIQQDELRVDTKCPRDLYSSAFSARKRIASIPANVLQA